MSSVKALFIVSATRLIRPTRPVIGGFKQPGRPHLAGLRLLSRQNSDELLWVSARASPNAPVAHPTTIVGLAKSPANGRGEGRDKVF